MNGSDPWSARTSGLQSPKAKMPSVLKSQEHQPSHVDVMPQKVNRESQEPRPGCPR